MNGKATVQIIGNMTRDPETKTVGEHTVTAFGIAVNRKVKGEDKPSFFDCSAWNKTGELIQEHFTKGKPISIDGRLEMDSWEDDGGQKRTRIKVVVDQFTFLPDGKGKEEGAEPAAKAAAPAKTGKAKAPALVPARDMPDEDEIPF